MDQIYCDIIGYDIIKKMRLAGLFKSKYVDDAVARVMDRAYVLGSDSEKYIADYSFASKEDLEKVCSKEDLDAGIASTTRKVNILCKACERVYMFGVYMNGRSFDVMH